MTSWWWVWLQWKSGDWVNVCIGNFWIIITLKNIKPSDYQTAPKLACSLIHSIHRNMNFLNSYVLDLHYCIFVRSCLMTRWVWWHYYYYYYYYSYRPKAASCFCKLSLLQTRALRRSMVSDMWARDKDTKTLPGSSSKNWRPHSHWTQRYGRPMSEVVLPAVHSSTDLQTTTEHLNNNDVSFN